MISDFSRPLPDEDQAIIRIINEDIIKARVDAHMLRVEREEAVERKEQKRTADIIRADMPTRKQNCQRCGCEYTARIWKNGKWRKYCIDCVKPAMIENYKNSRKVKQIGN